MCVITELWPRRITWPDHEKFFSSLIFNEPPLSAESSSPIDFMEHWSRGLMKYSEGPGHAEAVALGFWLRKSNMEKLAQSFKASLGKDEMAVPRGLAFHIAPSNVDAMFAYSWTLSVLAGNINIVRVSSRAIPGIQRLLAPLANWVDEPAAQSIIVRNMIVSYPHDDEITREISSRADVRIIWGGSQTVLNVLSKPGKDAGHDLRFVDKKSLAIIHAERYNAATRVRQMELAERFHRDGYTYEQMACSSPRVVVFVGEPDVCGLVAREFWKRLSEFQLVKPGRSTDVRNMDRILYGAELAARGVVTHLARPQQGEAYIMKVEPGDVDHALHASDFCGGGVFLEVHVRNLSMICQFVNRSIQTLTHAGFDRVQLEKLAAELNGKGIDRIVPFGDGLNFQTTWDGYPLMTELTRRVVVKA